MGARTGIEGGRGGGAVEVGVVVVVIVGAGVGVRMGVGVGLDLRGAGAGEEDFEWYEVLDDELRLEDDRDGFLLLLSRELELSR